MRMIDENVENDWWERWEWLMRTIEEKNKNDWWEWLIRMMRMIYGVTGTRVRCQMESEICRSTVNGILHNDYTVIIAVIIFVMIMIIIISMIIMIIIIVMIITVRCRISFNRIYLTMILLWNSWQKISIDTPSLAAGQNSQLPTAPISYSKCVWDPFKNPSQN